MRRAAVAVAAALALAACGPGGPAAERLAQPAPTLGGAQAAAGADGAALALTIWPADPGPARGVLLAAHGFGDHAGSAFGQAAPYWAAQGLEVWAYDHRGFGRNASRGVWPGADALIADFAAVATQACAARPDLPVTALGHSMGGGVALAALGEGDAPCIDRLILLAPAAAGGDATPAAARALAWTGAAVAPDRRWTGEGLVRVRATDNDDALRALRDDPLYLKGASAREIMGLVRVMDRAAAAAPGLTAPTLHIHGARDAITPAGPVDRVLATAPGPVTRLDRPEGWHLLLRDLDRAPVWRAVADFALTGAVDAADVARADDGDAP